MGLGPKKAKTAKKDIQLMPVSIEVADGWYHVSEKFNALNKLHPNFAI